MNFFIDLTGNFDIHLGYTIFVALFYISAIEMSKEPIQSAIYFNRIEAKLDTLNENILKIKKK